jgi:integrase family protein with SAM-like domain
VDSTEAVQTQSSTDSMEAYSYRCGAGLMLTRLDDYRRENGCRAPLRSSQIERAQVSPGGMSVNVEHVHAGWQQGSAPSPKFHGWWEQRGLRLDAIRPTTVAAYIEQLGTEMAKPSVKQHLAAVRQLFDYLVTGGLQPSNRAGAVRGPKYVVKRGKTSVLSADQARPLLDSIDVTELSGLRDRALIGVMVYGFARVSAAATLRVEDYFENGKRAWLRP